MDNRAPTKRQQQAAETHDQLLIAARDVFAERGYQATTVGAITERASTAHGTFYLHFRNKQDAFAMVMADVTDELYREADTQDLRDEPRAALERSIRGFLEVFVRHRRLWRCLLEGAFTNGEVEELWLSLRARFVGRIERDLTAFSAAGAVRPLDAALAANALGGMVEWAATTQFVLGAPSVADRSIDDTVTVLTDLWWSSVFATTRTPVSSGSPTT